MVGLKICLLLCLGYQVSHNHRVTGVSAWPAHEKHHNEIIKPVKSKNRFEKIGKFQQSSIGSRIAQTKKYNFNQLSSSYYEKKSSFLSSSKREHILLEGGVKISLSNVLYSILSFCFHSICSIS